MILYIYSWEAHRERQRQAEEETGSLCGAWCVTRSQDPVIMLWAEGRCSTTEPPRGPSFVFVLLWFCQWNKTVTRYIMKCFIVILKQGIWNKQTWSGVPKLFWSETVPWSNIHGLCHSTIPLCVSAQFNFSIDSFCLLLSSPPLLLHLASVLSHSASKPLKCYFQHSVSYSQDFLVKTSEKWLDLQVIFLSQEISQFMG